MARAPGVPGSVAVLGLGLIGGSLALALRQRGLVVEVIGVDVDPANLATARELGIVDRVEQDIGRAAAGADWVVMATPVGAMAAVLAALLALQGLLGAVGLRPGPPMALVLLHNLLALALLGAVVRLLPPAASR